MTKPAPLRLGYLGASDPHTSEDRAACAWLRNDDTFALYLLALPLRLPASLDVVWIHRSGPNETLSGKAHGTLRRYVEAGGRLLLTGGAAWLPHALGVEDLPPDVRPREIVDEGFGRPCGFQSFRGHPVLDAFHGGLFLWYPDEDGPEPRIGYFDDAWPVQGRVVGVEKTYLTLHPNARLLIEHTPGAGRILSAGAFIHFAPTNHHAQHTRRFVRHALRYLARSDADQQATYWTPTANPPTQVAIPPSKPLALGPEKPFDRPPSLALTRDPATDAFFDVAGRRCLMMGAERGGLAEVWIHPVRVLRDLEIGLVSNGDVRWLKDLPARVEVRPEAFIRTYDLPDGTLTETIVAALDAPGGVVRLTASVTEPLAVILRFRSDLRWMWPYAEGALGALRFGYDAGLHALHVHDPGGAVYALIGADQPPGDHLGGAFAGIDWMDGAFRGIPTGANHVYQAFRYTLGPANGYTLHLAIAGTDQGRAEAEPTFRRLLDDPGAVYEEAARHYRDLLKTSTTLTTPDPSFDEGYRWAIVGTDRFKATTPGLGTGLLAGYATSDRGWDGGHAVSGRPGYAWYFGRDAEWAGFAVDGYGDVETVRQQLLLFRDYQDLSGKIFHELPLSGVVHYDAADATPLYVILAAHYVRASGDLDTLRHLWPSLRRAMAFLYTTDTDGDGLIENTNVGHGWIEGGALYGAHVTLYLAGVWAQALRDAAYLAALFDDEDNTTRYARDARRVVATIERAFWNANTGFYHYGLRRDGTFIPEPTVLPAVLMHFRLLDPARVTTMLDAYASNAFSADWGVRILSAESSFFNPEGYHYGSVWPLFTGWAALAAYAYGRPAQGFTHVMQNLLQYRHDALGWMPEVLHGTHYRVQRVCPHQCWSEANVLHPIVAGLVGFHPDAPHHRLRLEPRIPLHWSTFRVDNLRTGTTRLRLTMRREARRTIYRLTRTEGPGVTIYFAPEIPHAMHVRAILINGVAQPPGRRSLLGLLDPPLTFYLDDNAVIDLRHSGGLGVVPYVPQPAPDAASQGYRIIREGMDGDSYVVTVEGPAATVGRFQIRYFDRTVARIDGANAAETTEDGLLTWAVSFPQNDGPWSRTTVRFYLA